MQTQMPREYPCRIKASPVIAYLEEDLVRLSCQPKHDNTGMCMLDNVVGGLLCDAVEALFPLKRESRLLTQICLDGQLVAGAPKPPPFCWGGRPPLRFPCLPAGVVEEGRHFFPPPL